MTAPFITPTWTLGDRLRKARDVAGLSQADMAEAIGIAPRSVHNYEHGFVTPRRPVLLSWTLATGVALDWLLHGEGGDSSPGDDTETEADTPIEQGFQSSPCISEAA